MIRRVSEHEQTDAGESVALFQINPAPEQMTFPVPDSFDHGFVYYGYFIFGFTFPPEPGEAEAEFSVSERGAYLLSTIALAEENIVTAVKVGGRWFICNRVYAP